MNDTKPVAYIGQAAKQSAQLRSSLERVRSRMQTHIAEVKREIDGIQESLAIRYTGWMALMKLEDGQWKCLACVKVNDVYDDTPMDFDLALPIPEPGSLPEFNGF